MIKRFFLKLFYRITHKTPSDFDMVSYWKTKDFVEAKLTTKDGATLMVMEGEKYPMWGFPRGHLLVPQSHTNYTIGNEELNARLKQYGPFSVLKHEIKQVFNVCWDKLERHVPKEQIIKEGKVQLHEAFKLVELLKYDLVPSHKMCPAVREIHRAWTTIGTYLEMRDVLCLLLQEDDGYRYRVQWMAIWIPWIRWNPAKILDYGLKMVERAEVIGDMKRKIKLLRRILSLAMEDPRIKSLFLRFFKEVSWKKVRITEQDRYHMRGKYFKVDCDVIEY
mgnify:CR=1 FL=1